MSTFDSLAEHYRQRALRALPRSHAVEGPHNAKPKRSPEEWIALAAFVIFVLIMLGAFER